MKLACNAGNAQCLSDTYVLVQQLANSNIPVPIGLEGVIYCSGFRGTGKQSTWVRMWQKMQMTSDATFKSQALSGLGCSDDPVVLKDYLESTLGSGNSVSYTTAERRNVVSAVLNSNSGLEAVISFFKDFELDILRTFGYGTLEAMVSVPARTVKTKAQQLMFMEYLLTLTHLEANGFKNVATIISNNLLVQETAANVKHMKLIRDILEDFNVVPTDTPTTTAPTTLV